MRFLTYALFCGGGAAIASFAAVAVNARIEDKSPWRPINATSHWLWGDEAARRDDPDLPHTGVGAATNLGASMFWGALFGAYLSTRPPQRPENMLLEAAAAGAIAGVVDYGLMPKRLTPGWELALSDRSVAISMAAMALGLAAGGFAAQAVLQEDEANA